MKKVMSGIIICLSIILLSGCSLAQEDDYYRELDQETSQNIEDYYIPSRVEFTLYNDDINQQIDGSEYFYVDLACPNQTVFDNCTGVDFGPSIDSSGVHIHTEDNTLNGVEQPRINTTTIELTLYALKESDLFISHRIVLENINGETKEESSYSTNFASGLTLTNKVEGETLDGTKHILDLTLHFVTLDVLEKVTVKQFDETDQLLEETIILRDELLEELILHEDTAYYFIIEEYLTEDDSYQERTYYETSTPIYYLYKYTNDDGFLDGDRLYIHEAK
jgi:hypothetical protein